VTWRDQLQRASFRGAPFHVRTADTEEGRRGVLFEYPQRDEPFVEDMGLKAGEFTLNAFVLGDDYAKARDALRDALKKPGPGELVHPTLGRLNVALTAPFRFTEDLVDEGRVARFTLRFTQTGDFGNVFSVDGLPEWVSTDAVAVLGEAMAALDAARAGLAPDLSVLGDFASELTGVTSSLSGLVRTPLTLASRIAGLMAGLSGSLSRPADSVGALGRLYGYSSSRPPVPTTTPSRRAQAANRAAVDSLLRRTAVIESARAAARLDFGSASTADPARRMSYQQAATLRERIADALDDEAADAPVPVFSTLMDLRTAMVRDITARCADLPRLATISMPATLPALVVAYRALGDARRETDLVARNPIRHPGFVTGGMSLEVLADA
jgi:prophage DNA circulation protein